MNNLILFIDKIAHNSCTTQLPFFDNNSIKFFKTSNSIPEKLLSNAKIVGIVLYDPFDLIEVISLYNRSYLLLIASADSNLLKAIDKLDYAFPINLQNDENTIEAEIVSILRQLEEKPRCVSNSE